MKLRIVSLMGLLFAIVATSGNAFAQKIMNAMSAPKHFIILNQENSKEMNLDLEIIKSSLNAKEDDKIFVSIDEQEETINLGIYNITEFSVSRVDRDGAGH